jgi:hypothetical protein
VRAARVVCPSCGPVATWGVALRGELVYAEQLPNRARRLRRRATARRATAARRRRR